MEILPIYLALFIFFVWLVGISYFLLQTVSHYKNIIRFTNKQNLKEAIDQLLENQKGDRIALQELNRYVQQLSVESKLHIQKIGILRFNPFADTGGEQSFILAILDGTNSGVVITSLQNRGTTRWYVKNVGMGKGIDFQLSEEEENAIHKAVSLRK